MQKAKSFFNRIMCIPMVEGCTTYSEFYKENWKHVYRYFCNDLQDMDEAQDVTQDVFEKLWVNLFRQNEEVDKLARVHSENLTYHAKCIVGSVRANRNTNQSRRIKAQLESQMYDNPNVSESPLEAALNKHDSIGDPYMETRLNYFIEDIKDTFADKKISDTFIYLFFGYSHDDAQKLANITHGTFYRKYKENREAYEAVVEKHFERSELNGSN